MYTRFFFFMSKRRRSDGRIYIIPLKEIYVWMYYNTKDASMWKSVYAIERRPNSYQYVMTAV